MYKQRYSCGRNVGSGCGFNLNIGLGSIEVEDNSTTPLRNKAGFSLCIVFPHYLVVVSMYLCTVCICKLGNSGWAIYASLWTSTSTRREGVLEWNSQHHSELQPYFISQQDDLEGGESPSAIFRTFLHSVSHHTDFGSILLFFKKLMVDLEWDGMRWDGMGGRTDGQTDRYSR